MPKPLRFAARAFAEALFASDDGPPDAARLDWILDEVEDFLARSGFRAQAVFQASMLAITTTAPLTIGKPVPLPWLDWRERIHAIERFERTPLGLAVLGANLPGKKLTLHPGFRMIARFDEEVEGWKDAMQSAFSDAFEEHGLTLVSVHPGERDRRDDARHRARAREERA